MEEAMRTDLGTCDGGACIRMKGRPQMTLGTLHPEMEERDSKLGRILNPQNISKPLAGAAVTLVRSQGDTLLTSLPPLLVPPAGSVSGCKVPSVIYGRPFILIHTPPSQIHPTGNVEAQNLAWVCYRGHYCCCSFTKSCLTLRLHGLQHARFPCPSPSPVVCSNSCPLSQ